MFWLSIYAYYYANFLYKLQVALIISSEYFALLPSKKMFKKCSFPVNDFKNLVHFRRFAGTNFATNLLKNAVFSFAFSLILLFQINYNRPKRAFSSSKLQFGGFSLFSVFLSKYFLP